MVDGPEPFFGTKLLQGRPRIGNRHKVSGPLLPDNLLRLGSKIVVQVECLRRRARLGGHEKERVLDRTSLHRAPNLGRIGRVENDQITVSLGGPKDQPHGLRRQTAAAHPEQHDPLQPRSADFGRQCLEACRFDRHELRKSQPTKAILNLGDCSNVLLPQSPFSRPQARCNVVCPHPRQGFVKSFL